MTWVRDNWRVVLVVTIVALVAIRLFEPDYNALQTAGGADGFREELGDDKGRAVAANLSDFVFAAGYGVLGVLAARSLGTGGRAAITAGLAIGAAVFDEIENALVLRNILGVDDLTDSWVDAMRGVGSVKLTFFYLAVGALAGLLILRVLRRRRARPDGPA